MDMERTMDTIRKNHIHTKHTLTLHASLCFDSSAAAHKPGLSDKCPCSSWLLPASMPCYACMLLCSNTHPDELSEFPSWFYRLIDFVATLSMLLDIPAVVNGLNRISSSSSTIEADEVSFLARGTSNTSANKARQIMRVCRILRLMRLVYLYNQYELHKQVRALLNRVRQLASRTWHMQDQCASTCVNEGHMSLPLQVYKSRSSRKTL